MPLKKRKRVSRSLARRRPTYVCPNPLYQEVLPSKSGLTNPCLHFTTCSQVNTSILSILEATNEATIDRGSSTDTVGTLPNGYVRASPSIDRGSSTDTVAVDIDPCTHSDLDDDANALFDFEADYPENEAKIGVAYMAVKDNAN
jgi:hypothetical protein